MHIPTYMYVHGSNVISIIKVRVSLTLVQLTPAEELPETRWLYHTIYGSTLSPPQRTTSGGDAYKCCHRPYTPLAI